MGGTRPDGPNVVIITRIPSENGYLLDAEFYPKKMPLGGLEYAIVRIVERVGPDRVLYGSDAPFHHPAVELAKVRVSGLPPDLADRVLGENGRRLFFGEHVPDTVG